MCGVARGTMSSKDLFHSYLGTLRRLTGASAVSLMFSASREMDFSPVTAFQEAFDHRFQRGEAGAAAGQQNIRMHFLDNGFDRFRNRVWIIGDHLMIDHRVPVRLETIANPISTGIVL